MKIKFLLLFVCLFILLAGTCLLENKTAALAGSPAFFDLPLANQDLPEWEQAAFLEPYRIPIQGILTPGHYLGSLQVAGDYLFFVVQDFDGYELWRSDGTAMGTIALMRMHGNWFPWLGTAKGVLFFNGRDEDHGEELWRSDGTVGGTTMVKDIVPGPQGSAPINFITFQDDIFFTNDFSTAEIPPGLWRSNGTEEGTQVVINSDTDVFSYLRNITVVNDNLYFNTDSSSGPILWRSDGTEAGTTPVKETYADNLIGYQGNLYFAEGPRLWRSDGTEEGTQVVKEFPGQQSTITPPPVVVGDILFFSTSENYYYGIAEELWRTDGTTKDSKIDQEMGEIYEMVGFAGSLFLATRNDDYYEELWRSDGTDEGTELVRTFPQDIVNNAPMQLTVHNETLFFAGFDEQNGRELWKSDGSSTGTIIVKDIRSGPLGSGVSEMGDFAGNLFFIAYSDDDQPAIGIWQSDGTEEGTTIVASSFRSQESGSRPRALTPALGNLFLGALGNSDERPGFFRVGTSPDQVSLLDDDMVVNRIWPLGNHLLVEADLLRWSDGTPAATKILGSGTVEAAGDALYVVDEYEQLPLTSEARFKPQQHYYSIVRINKQGQITYIFNNFKFTPVEEIPMAELDGYLLFAGWGIEDIELYISNGAQAGSRILRDIYPGEESSFPADFMRHNGYLFFTAGHPDYGRELWRTDGTEEGTILLGDLTSGPGSSTIENMTAVGDWLFFSRKDPNDRYHIYKSDGTSTGTSLVKSLGVAQTAEHEPANFTAVGDNLFFSMWGELWTSDGSEVGTHLLRNISLTGNGSPQELVDLHGSLFFTAIHDDYGRELWRSDGTEDGTIMVRDIRPGPDGSDPNQLKAAGKWLLFTAVDGIHGRELWQSAGTETGTVMVADINPGPAAANPSELTAAFWPRQGRYLYFAAEDGQHGQELWIYPLEVFTNISNLPIITRP